MGFSGPRYDEINQIVFLLLFIDLFFFFLVAGAWWWRCWWSGGGIPSPFVCCVLGSGSFPSLSVCVCHARRVV